MTPETPLGLAMVVSKHANGPVVPVSELQQVMASLRAGLAADDCIRNGRGIDLKEA